MESIRKIEGDSGKNGRKGLSLSGGIWYNKTHENSRRGRRRIAEDLMLYAVLALILVILDQVVKYLVLQNIPLGGHVPFIPYIVELTYVQNTGAAFSMMSEHTWILTVISLVMSVVLAVAIWKNFFRHWFGKLTLTLLLAGAVGNLIDRALRGFVVDMFNVLFMEFAVFNVADICVVVGGIAAAAYYLLLVDKLEGNKEPTEEKETGDGDSDAAV